MATAAENLEPDPERSRNDYAASHEATQRAAANPNFIARLRQKVAELDERIAPGPTGS